MGRNVKQRAMTTRLVETGETINTRIIAEAVAKNILTGVIHHDREREV